MDTPSPVSRRRFLQAGAAVAASVHIVPRHVLGGPRYVAPSDKVNIALVGAGGQGRSNVRELFEHADAQVVAVADPAESFSLDRFYYGGMGGRKPVIAEIEEHYRATSSTFRCAEYVDFRELLDRERSIDAVLCATPDHLHAWASLLAMRAGKHVYCEKPLTHNIWEARTVARVAKETGVATQLGNQGHASDTLRETVDWIRAGVIGPVREVHAWVATSRWNPCVVGHPLPPAPEGLNWDLWLGPRDPRPFHPAYFPVSWRDFWDFGGSTIADFGCHDLDSTFWALDPGMPEIVEFKPAGPMDAEIAPFGSIGYFRFPRRGEGPGLTITWYDGGLQPPRPEGLPEGESLPGRGQLFVGEKGMMLGGRGEDPPRLLGREAGAKPEPKLPRSKGHHREWLDACKGGPPPASNFEYGARLTELVLLGVLSLRTGKQIRWDHEKMRAAGVPEAEPIIRESYRNGWELD